LSRGRVLEDVAAGRVENIGTGLLLKDGNVELLVGLRPERTTLDGDAYVRISLPERLHGRI
jgi:hypothetical protein